MHLRHSGVSRIDSSEPAVVSDNDRNISTCAAAVSWRQASIDTTEWLVSRTSSSRRFIDWSALCTHSLSHRWTKGNDQRGRTRCKANTHLRCLLIMLVRTLPTWNN